MIAGVSGIGGKGRRVEEQDSGEGQDGMFKTLIDILESCSLCFT
jgi:hypothetical protein